MEEARKRLRVCLIFIVALAVVVGCIYYFGDAGKAENISEGTLVKERSENIDVDVLAKGQSEDTDDDILIKEQKENRVAGYGGE